MINTLKYVKYFVEDGVKPLLPSTDGELLELKARIDWFKQLKEKVVGTLNQMRRDNSFMPKDDSLLCSTFKYVDDRPFDGKCFGCPAYDMQPAKRKTNNITTLCYGVRGEKRPTDVLTSSLTYVDAVIAVYTKIATDYEVEND